MSATASKILLRVAELDFDPLWIDLTGLVVKGITIGPAETKETVRWLWDKNFIVITSDKLPFRYTLSEIGERAAAAIRSGESSGDQQKDALDRFAAKVGDMETFEETGVTKRVLAVPKNDAGQLEADRARWIYSTGAIRSPTSEDIERVVPDGAIA